MFQDALRIAKKQKMDRVNEINNIIAKGVENSSEDKLQTAQM